MIRQTFAHAIASANASAPYGGEDYAADVAAVWAAFDAAVAQGGWFLDCDDAPALIRAHETIDGAGEYELDIADAQGEARVALAMWLDCDVPA